MKKSIKAEVGLTITDAGQEYACISSEPYLRKRYSRMTELFTWESKCDYCRKKFRFKTPGKVKGFNRNCDKHRTRFNP